MKNLSIWDALVGRLRPPSGRRSAVRVHFAGLDAYELEALRPVLAAVGERLALRLELSALGGEVMLMHVDYAANHPSQALRHAVAGRLPVVLVPALDDADLRALSPDALSLRLQADLLRQFKDVPVVRDRSPHWGAAGWDLDRLDGEDRPSLPLQRLISAFDSSFDTEIHAEQLAAESLDEPRRALVQQVLDGLRSDAAAPLSASYGPSANLVFDFRARLLTIDTAAQRLLRVQRELPLAAPGARPQPNAAVRELDEAVWDLGIACGTYGLVDEPPDWWHTRLAAAAPMQLERYTRMPRHLELARRLAASPATPSELRRHVRVSVIELRRFLQACLFLGLLRWEPHPAPPA